MTGPGRWRRRLVELTSRRRFERELAEELDFHLEMTTRELEASGLAPEEARRRARRELGNLTRAREESREPWGWPTLDAIGQDVRFAVRWLRRNPLFAVAAVLTLGLGLGATTALFSVLDPLLMDRLPVERPAELYAIGRGMEEGTQSVDAPRRDTRIFSVPMARHLEREIGAGVSLVSMASYTPAVYLREPGVERAPERVRVRLVSGRFFEVLGARASLGRVLGPADDEGPQAERVAVISERLHRRVFAGDPSVVGREIVLNEQTFTVVGVAQPRFDGVRLDRATEVWIPLAHEAALDAWEPRNAEPSVMWLRILARVPDGVPLAGVESQLTALYRGHVRDEFGGDLAQEDEEHLEGQRLELASIARGLSGLRDLLARPLGLLSVVVLMVLLIACANVANLLLARASARSTEIAARLALGASRGRLVRQLLTESLLLAVGGAAVGLVVASLAGRALLSLLTGGSSLAVESFAIDLRVLGFGLALAIPTVLLFGLAPALRATRPRLAPALRSGEETSRPGARFTLGRGLVVVQIALSVVLLAGAGLFLRTLANLESADPGYEHERIAMLTIDPRGGGYREEDTDPAELIALDERLLEAVEAVPGVRSASLSIHALLSGSRWTSRIVSDGGLEPDEGSGAETLVVAGHYFETLGLRLLEGRTFRSADDGEAPRVAVINRSMARHFFGEGSAVGRRFGYDEEGSREFEVIGVVSDFAVHDLTADPPRLMFFPLAQQPVDLYSVEARIEGDVEATIPGIRQAIERVAPEVPILSSAPMSLRIRRTFERERQLSLLLGVFGISALVLTAIGLYGVLAYSVSRRVRELGIRVAIGAERGRIVGLVLSEAAVLAAVGLVAGALLIALLSRLVAGFLYGLGPTDPTTLFGACLLFAAVALAAAWVPAWRAARLDPVVALRGE